MREHQRLLKLPKSAREAIEELRQDLHDAEIRTAKRRGLEKGRLHSSRGRSAGCYCGRCHLCNNRLKTIRYRQRIHDRALVSPEVDSRMISCGWLFGWYEVAGKYFQVKSQLSGLQQFRVAFK